MSEYQLCTYCRSMCDVEELNFVGLCRICARYEVGRWEQVRAWLNDQWRAWKGIE